MCFSVSRKYSSAEQNDLWEALTLYAHKYNVLDKNISVKQIMDTWTLQTGVPVVTVTRNYTDRSAVLTQERFLLLENKMKAQSQCWWIPITYTTQNELDFKNTSTRMWLQNVQEGTIADIDINENEWVIVNVQETGYYRVNYDNNNWHLLTNYLRNMRTFTDISPINRAQLLNDALNLARAGRLDYGIALNVTRYLVHEKEYVPWQVAFSALSYIDVMFIRTGHYDKFKVSDLIKLIFGRYSHISCICFEYLVNNTNEN